MNVVPNKARITVMTRDSKYSRGVDLRYVSSVIISSRFELVQSLPCRSLFGGFLGEAQSARKWLAVHDDIHRKQLFVVWSGLATHHVIRSLQLPCLNLLLQRRFEIGHLIGRIADIFNLPSKKSQHQTPRLVDATIQVHGTENGLERVHKQGLF